MPRCVAQWIPSLYSPFATSTLFFEYHCRIYAKIGLGALSQTLPPPPASQLPFYRVERHRAHGAVALPRVSA